MTGWTKTLKRPVEIREDDRFICSHDQFQAWATGRKQLRMEYFYREMRKSTGLLMDGDQPEGGKWNYDADNRKPAKADLFIPRPFQVPPNRITADVIELVASEFSDHFGDLTPFWFGVTSTDAENALDHFVEHALPSFGDYQDAMLEGERISISLSIITLSELRVARSLRGVSPGGNGLQRRPRTAQRGRRIYSPDYRLARICKRHLLVKNARLPG